MRKRPCGWRRTNCHCGRRLCSATRHSRSCELRVVSDWRLLKARSQRLNAKGFFMDAEKIRNLTGEELSHQEKEMSDQLFKLKFQLNMGQTESLKKIRGLRKDIARVKTIVRERAAATAALTAASKSEKK